MRSTWYMSSVPPAENLHCTTRDGDARDGESDSVSRAAGGTARRAPGQRRTGLQRDGHTPHVDGSGEGPGRDEVRVHCWRPGDLRDVSGKPRARGQHGRRQKRGRGSAVGAVEGSTSLAFNRARQGRTTPFFCAYLRRLMGSVQWPTKYSLPMRRRIHSASLLRTRPSGAADDE